MNMAPCPSGTVLPAAPPPPPPPARLLQPLTPRAPPATAPQRPRRPARLSPSWAVASVTGPRPSEGLDERELLRNLDMSPRSSLNVYWLGLTISIRCTAAICQHHHVGVQRLGVGRGQRVRTAPRAAGGPRRLPGDPGCRRQAGSLGAARSPAGARRTRACGRP